ncbi:hypothetical protein [Aliiroseovarius crassostreae]|uniref:hypothetical protein n=1 Tax=Aliiroseovarius crassostreae TaxID=154981 RepID=UPI002203F538|nr:hypothetical protein [Aliiroseovarius crassostreae]UWP89487.1 hypothetical protein K3J57_01900 [Aliiroseovarius crassostreae]UWQ02129.1 hypothetical protein K3X44_01900 [Aliiroseovarius crassostreae]
MIFRFLRKLGWNRSPPDTSAPYEGYFQLWITDPGPDLTPVARVVAENWDSELDQDFLGIFAQFPWHYQSLEAGSDSYSILHILAAEVENAGGRTEIIAAPDADTPYPTRAGAGR